MGAYILRRLLLVIPTLLGIMIINFALIQFVPGGPIEQIIGHSFDDIAPLHRIGDVECPVLIVHGDADRVVGNRLAVERVGADADGDPLAGGGADEPCTGGGHRHHHRRAPG